MHTHPHGESEAQGPILRRLSTAVNLSLVILAIEVVGAYLSRSLSLSVDAVHNVPDILAFAVSWHALRSTVRGSYGSHTFGAHRLEVFAGLLNAALILGTGVAFGVEATLSLLSGGSFAGPVSGFWILVVAAPTLGLRSVNMAVLGRLPSRFKDLNLRSVFLHLSSDVAITGALLVAGSILWLHSGWSWVDEAGALAIALILVYESLPLMREGWEVLTERIPRGLSVDAITKVALEVPGVAELHDVHVWSVCSTLICMTACVGLKDMSLSASTEVTRKLRERMEKEFGIVHATFETVCLPPR